MKIDILSLFPEYFQGPFSVSLLKRAQAKGLLEIRQTDIRQFSESRHGKVDDRPYGGGPGMVLMPGPVCRAIRSVCNEESHVICLSPRGKPLDAKKSRMLATKKHLVLLCGHYEGIDERVLEKEVDEIISIGDYVLPSGCAAAVVIVEAVARFVPGVLGNELAVEQDSFEGCLLEAPQYTRPEEFEGVAVPQVLLQGNHGDIERWRKEQAELQTKSMRPDLWCRFQASCAHEIF